MPAHRAEPEHQVIDSSARLLPSTLGLYPAKAKAESAEIHLGDESALINTYVRGRSYAPLGQTLVTFAVVSTRHKEKSVADTEQLEGSSQ